MSEKLLERTHFKDAVFKRDGYVCVFCSAPAVDAHHILDRKLWPDGGYYIDNGASVCSSCHIDCERSVLTVEDCREACGITNIIVPPYLHVDQEYDKWGNPTTRWIKYPRTPHLPWSPGVDDDDIVTGSEHFEGNVVVVTEKFDGENTTMYRDHIHARSLDSQHHVSRDWVKSFWGERKYEIPEGWRVCGENVYAQHSIRYENLESYFLGFSIWTDQNKCLSWPETLEWFELLGITPVRTFFLDVYNEEVIKSLYDPRWYSFVEGYVVRNVDGFAYSEFVKNIAKYVRKNHITTTEHWMKGPVVPNATRDPCSYSEKT
jgi:hypothetical protein